MRAGEAENPELFWALHGGGGNFGVATSFTFRLHALPSVTAMLLFWKPEAGGDVLRAYRDFMDAAPDEVGGGVLYLTAPQEEFVPGDLAGRLALAVVVVYAGPEAEARRAASQLLSLGPEGEMIAEMPYADFQCMLDDPPGHRNYWTAEYLDDFPDEAVERVRARAKEMIVPSATQLALFAQGGAVGRGRARLPGAMAQRPVGRPPVRPVEGRGGRRAGEAVGP